MRAYDHKKIEEKWQKEWEKSELYKTEDEGGLPKCYVLDMFPYPSGEGLHVGHPKGYIATDVYARMKRMQGFNVLHPMGWDAFGLPAEQYALKNKVHPRVAVEKNVARYKAQLSRLGFNYDWSREVNTTDPEFYKWTQWIFKQLWKAGLAYESFEPINWCPVDKTGLSNEDLENGNCERCGSPVVKKAMRQWVLKITEYADRLLQDLDGLNWPEHIKESQRNWIGKSEGAEIEFTLSGIVGQEDGKHKVKVFTTRPDTLFGATYLAISTELAQKWVAVGWSPSAEVKGFIARLEAEEKEHAFDFKEVVEKKGVATGIFATNPANGEKIPVWIANYVLSGYGTGAIMAVPAHDERDFDFAHAYSLSRRTVVLPESPESLDLKFVNSGFSHAVGFDVLASELGWKFERFDLIKKSEIYYSGTGILTNSGKFDGMESEEAQKAITDFVGGKMVSQYRLKDWVFARQRYWGEPFPIVFDVDHKAYVVADSELPVKLPDVKAYEPTDTGESPLANIREWVEVYGYLNADSEFVSCEKGDPKALLFTRETNTMPQWAGSSWYYLRYIDPANKNAFVDKEKEKAWSPVDFYVGGAEHATRHLIYARFWHKFLFDIGVVSHPEPFSRLQNVGLIMADDGRKMSKRYGNVINPDDIVDTYGADSLRIYEMFMGPFGQSIAWSTDNLIGARRFIERVWRLQEKIDASCIEDKATELLRHQTIKKVSEDIESFAFNTAIAQLMVFLNHCEKQEHIPRAVFLDFLTLIAPFAPHVSEEIWHTLSDTTDSLHRAPWPQFDQAKSISDTVVVGVQLNGKLRETLEIHRTEDEERVKERAISLPVIQKWLDGAAPKKVIYVSGKIINIVF